MFRTVSDRHISGMFGHMKQLTPWPRWGGMSMATFHPRLYDFESMRADIFRKSKAKTTFFWLFRLPSKIVCCSSWPVMLLPAVYFRVFFVFGESHTRRIWESRHLVLKNSHASMQQLDLVFLGLPGCHESKCWEFDDDRWESQVSAPVLTLTIQDLVLVVLYQSFSFHSTLLTS